MELDALLEFLKVALGVATLGGVKALHTFVKRTSEETMQPLASSLTTILGSTMACNSCKLCTRDMPAPDAPRGVTRHRQLGRTLDPWGVFAGSSVGGVRWSLLSPCDELVGIHAGLYDALGEPLEGVGSLLDSFTARRQISQIEWPRGVGLNGLPFDGATWSRYRQVQNMRVTTGAIRASASRAREACLETFKAPTMPRKSLLCTRFR